MFKNTFLAISPKNTPIFLKLPFEIYVSAPKQAAFTKKSG